MGRKYAIRDQEKFYFVTFTIVYWLDVFIRVEYKSIFLDSVRYCQKEKGLLVGAWCMMTSHVHMAIGTKGDNKLEDIIRNLKSYTSRHIRKYIENNPQESLKEYLLWMMERAASKNATVNKRQFWHGPTFRQHNHPIELATNEMMQQRIDYIHNNPVESLFVTNASDWIYSSAVDYEGGKGLVDIYFLDWHGVFPKTFGRYGLSETLRPDQGC